MKSFKTFFAIVLTIIMVVCFASCQESQNKPSEATQTNIEPTVVSNTEQSTVPTELSETVEQTQSTEPTAESTTSEVVVPQDRTIIEEVSNFTSPSLGIKSITYRIVYTDGTTENFKVSISPIKYVISEHKSNSGFFKLVEGNVSLYIEPYISDGINAPQMYDAMPYYTWIEVENNDGQKIRYEDGLLHELVFSGPLGLITDMDEIMDTPGQYEGTVYVLVYSEIGDYVDTVSIPIVVEAV